MSLNFRLRKGVPSRFLGVGRSKAENMKYYCGQQRQHAIVERDSITSGSDKCFVQTIKAMIVKNVEKRSVRKDHEKLTTQAAKEAYAEGKRKSIPNYRLEARSHYILRHFPD